MDIIPEPSSAHPPVIVPLLAVIPYTPGAFIDFPCRAGFDLEHVRHGDKSALEVAILLQSWLCFGLIQEIWPDHDFNIDDFAVPCEQSFTRRALSLVPLSRKLLDEIRTRHPVSRTRARKINSPKMISLIKGAWEVLDVFDDSPHCTELASPFCEVHLSVHIMLELVAMAFNLNVICRHTIQPLVRSLLADRGWCPSRIRQIEELRNNTLGYYLSRTSFPRRPNVSHDRCPDTHCTASNTTLSGGYERAHTCVQRDFCTNMSVDRTKVTQIIMNGKIPLISIDQNITGEIYLRIKEATANDSYIAISHVWSDGLGNPEDNALSKCQLERLIEHLQSLPYPNSHSIDHGRTRSGNESINIGPLSWGPMYIDIRRFKWNLWKNTNRKLFWLDTLCIPVATGLQGRDAKMANEAKRRAIHQMAMIYGRASQVLVLDYVLLKSSLAMLTKEEILSRITFSAWMGRSWTLQEGALSPHVYFQYLDGAICPRYQFPDPHAFDYRLVTLRDYLKSLWWGRRLKRLREQNQTYQETESDSQALPSYIKTRLIFEPLLVMCEESYFKLGTERTYNTSSFIKVWNALATRTTTMEKDLPAMFANMLQLNAYRILALPEEEQLHAIMMVSDTLPVSLLYSRGARLRPGGNHNGRWIPVVPTHSPLDETPRMDVDTDDNLILSSESDGTAPFLLKVQARVPIGTTRLVVKTSDQTLLVAFHRENNKCEDGSEEDDHLDIQPFDSIAILIKSDSGECCCLRTCSDGRKAIYDCPCTVETINIRDPEHENMSHSIHNLQPNVLATGSIRFEHRDHKKPMPVYEGEWIDEWNIVISSKSKPACKPFHRRCAHWFLDETFYLYNLGFALPYATMYIAVIYLRVYIATQHPLSDLSVIGWAALISFPMARFVVPFMYIPWISTILFLIDAKKSRVGLSAPELSYVILDFLWPALFPFMFIWHAHSLERWARDAELAVLKESWSEPRIYNVVERWYANWEDRWKKRGAKSKPTKRVNKAGVRASDEDIRGLLDAYEMERR